MGRGTRWLLGGALVSLLMAAACGREQAPDLVNGKQLFIEKCGSCHVLDRAGTVGTIAPDLDAAFGQARRDGLGQRTIRGVVRDQIDHPLRGSRMPADLVTGDDARDVAAYVAEVAGVPGEDTGRLARVGPAGANGPEQIFIAAGCGSCHTLGAAGSSSDVGPGLDDLARVARQRQPGVSAADYVRQSIVEPDAFVVQGFQQGVMPSDYRDRLTDEQLDAVLRYLLEGGDRS